MPKPKPKPKPKPGSKANLTKPGTGKPKPGPKKKTVVKKAKMKVKMKLKNVDFKKLDDDTKEEIKAKVVKTIAKKAGVPESAVIVELSAGSVKNDATIDLKSKAQKAGGEMKSQEEIMADTADMDFSGVESEIVAEVKEIDGVQEAATGEIEMEAPTYDVDVEVEEAAVDDTGAPSPAPSPDESLVTEAPSATDEAVDGSTGKSALMALAICV